MTKKLEELLNLPESQEIVKEEQEKAQAEDKKQKRKAKVLNNNKPQCETLPSLTNCGGITKS